MKKNRNTALICTRNRPDDIRACLNSLGLQTFPFDQLIIVDSSDTPLNTSTHFNDAVQSAGFQGGDFVYLHTSPGLPYQRNQGIKHVTGDVVYFFDDDVVLSSDYLEQMSAVYQQYPSYAGGMGNVTNVAIKTSWYSFFSRFFLLAQQPGSGSFTCSGQPTMPFGRGQFALVSVLSGCCASYRTAVFTNYQFDEALGGYACMEDCDMSKRVSTEHQLFYTPHALLVHNVSPVARDGARQRAAQYMRNYTYLFFKNFYVENRLRICAYAWSLLGLFLKAVCQRDWNSFRGYCDGLFRPVRKPDA